MKSVSILVVAALLLWSSPIVNAHTNSVTGLLGYPIGTPLKIEGRMLRPIKEYSILVDKVNDKELPQPVSINLGIICGPIIDFSNAVVCLKGVEWIETVHPRIDPQTGVPIMQQQVARTYFRFAVQDVIKPEGLTVENGYWKTMSEQGHGD